MSKPWAAAPLAVIGLIAGPGVASAGTARFHERFDGRSGETSQNFVYRAAGPQANDVTVSRAGTTGLRVVDPAGVTPGPGCAREGGDPTRAVCTYRSGASAGAVDVRLGRGADRARFVEMSGELSGGPGDDTLEADAAFNTRLRGGPGDDTVRGGSGDDLFVEERGASGADTYSGGGGDDSLSLEARRGGVRVSLDGRANDGAPGERDDVGRDVEGVFAGPGDDTLIGNGGRNRLIGSLGSDSISGLGGDDSLEGTSNATGARRTRGRDRLRGGRGDDVLYAGDARVVTLAGGPGQDSLSGGSGRNRIAARDGQADYVECFGGPDLVRADGQDFVAGARGIPGRCERIRRTGRAAGLLASVGPQFVNTVDEFLGRSFEIHVGCVADGPRRCRGGLVLRLGREVLYDGPFAARRGHTRRRAVRVSPGLRERLRAEGELELQATVTSRARGGRAIVRVRPLRLTSDPTPR